MKFSEFLLDETIKLYAATHKGFADKALNITRIAKVTGFSTPMVWRQINKKGNIRAESFFRLVSSMGNCEFDVSRCGIFIKVTDTVENRNLMDRFSNCHFKDDYI